MRYEIPYNPEKALLQYNLVWKETSKEVHSMMKQYGILSAILLVAAVIIALDNAYGVVMLLFAMMIGFNFLLFLFRYRQGKRKFYTEIKQVADVYRKQPSFSMVLTLSILKDNQEF